MACRATSKVYWIIHHITRDVSVLSSGLEENIMETIAAFRIYRFHFLVGVDSASVPGVEGAEGDGLDAGDFGFDGFGKEGLENELPELGVVGALVKEDGLATQHPLLAGGEGGFEEVSSSAEHEFGRLWA